MSAIAHTFNFQNDSDICVHVEWDADEYINTYRYGGTGYDLVPVDEIRTLKTGEDIAVGCQVKPGNM